MSRGPAPLPRLEELQNLFYYMVRDGFDIKGLILSKSDFKRIFPENIGPRTTILTNYGPMLIVKK